MKHKDADRDAPKPKHHLRQALVILLIAVIVTVAIDGWFNHWDSFRMLFHWRTLALHTEEGDEWTLSSGRAMTVLRIEGAARLAHLDSLRAFDRPYRTAGFYRLYFRRSDSLSSTLNALYAKLLQHDQGHMIGRTLFTGGKALHSVLQFFGQDTTKDTAEYVPPPMAAEPPSDGSTPGILDDTIRIGTLWSGRVSDVTDAGTKLVGRSPTAVIGIGLGVVAAAGLDMLRGEVYVAYAPSDAFRLQTIAVGPRAGSWEGRDIDILWAFAPGDLDRPERDSTAQAR